MAIFLILILLVSVTFHEYAHGWIAYKLGDSTAKNSGRLTLNPIAHIDPFGTLILPILLLLISQGTFAFGYAKPVPINPYHFKNPKKDMRWVGVAGPLANILIALFLTALLKIEMLAFSEILVRGIVWGIMINLILAIFNAIPIPPLDGSKIVASFLPSKLSYKYLRLQTYGFIFILILIKLRFFDWFMLPVIYIIFSLLRIKEYYPF